MAYDSLDILNSLSLTTCPMSPCTTSMVAFELVRERNAASDGAGPKCVQSYQYYLWYMGVFLKRIW